MNIQYRFLPINTCFKNNFKSNGEISDIIMQENVIINYFDCRRTFILSITL